MMMALIESARLHRFTSIAVSAMSWVEKFPVCSWLARLVQLLRSLVCARTHVSCALSFIANIPGLEESNGLTMNISDSDVFDGKQDASLSHFQ